MATEEQIKVLLRAAISPLDKKMDHLTTEFAELKRSVEFLSKKYDEVISQLQVANNRISQQSTTIKNVQEELNNVKKQAIDASYQAEELAQYIRRDCLEISGVLPSESYSSNDIVRSVGNLLAYKSQMEIFLPPILYPPSELMLCQRLLSSLSEEMFATGFMQTEESL